MAKSWKSYNINNSEDTAVIGSEIVRRWLEVSETPNVMRYKLNVRKERVLEGKYGFLMQLNVERGTQRRPPITIQGLRPQFDEDLFNFNKISDAEHMLDIRYLDFIVTIIVNQSPICKFHSLIVPSLEACLPQILTRDALQFAIRILRVMNSYEFKIGYNSPGACASVNHLHLHLIHSTSDLFAQRAELHKLRSGIYCFSPESEIKAICFLVRGLAHDENESEPTDRAYKLVRYMIDHNMPHNLFFTLSKHRGEKVMRVVVFPREKRHEEKKTTELNIAFCELSGFIPVANERTYKLLEEAQFLELVKAEQSSSFEKVLLKVKDPRFYPPRRRRQRRTAHDVLEVNGHGL